MRAFSIVLAFLHDLYEWGLAIAAVCLGIATLFLLAKLIKGAL